MGKFTLATVQKNYDILLTKFYYILSIFVFARKFAAKKKNYGNE